MGKLPGFTFYSGDWLKDPELRRCTKAAKGVWIDMLALMFECADRGVFSTGGRPWSDLEIAAAVGGDIAENQACIAELLLKGVAHRNESGAIFCKRMVRDQQGRLRTQERVKKHRSNGSCNGSVTPLYEQEQEVIKDFDVGSTESKESKPDKSDEVIEEIAKSHPANLREKKPLTFIPPAQCDVIMKAIIRDGPELVRQGTLAYARAVERWPQDERKYILGVIKFFDTSEYLKDPKHWERSNGTGTTNRVSAAAERVANTRQAITNVLRNCVEQRTGRDGGEQQNRPAGEPDGGNLPKVLTVSTGGN